MADRPQQYQRPELQYRDGRQDMRPKSEGDVGCAIVFGLIAMATTGGAVAIVAFDWRRNGISFGGIVAVLGLLLFAAGSIIAVCARLLPYRWWAHTGWRGPDRGDDGV